jgi:hypothetical protein
MVPSQKTRLTRMSACRSDLSDNGIHTDAMPYRKVCDLARRNLEYFQSMLGYNAGLREIVALLERTREPDAPAIARFRVGPAAAPAGRDCAMARRGFTC